MKMQRPESGNTGADAGCNTLELRYGARRCVIACKLRTLKKARALSLVLHGRGEGRQIYEFTSSN